MQERFNFYDVYVYLLPGLVAVALYCTPIVLATGEWPATQLSETLAIVLLGYVVGHVLAEVGRSLPWLRDAPSSRMLMGTEDERLAPELLARVREGICKRLGVPVDRALSPKESDGVFRYARMVVVQEGKPGYFEQFQGMYGLTRGLSAGLMLAAVSSLAWGIAAWAQLEVPSGVRAWGGGVIVAMSLVVLIGSLLFKTLSKWLDQERDLPFLGSVAVVVVAFGWLGASYCRTPSGDAWQSLAASPLLALFSLRFASAYRAHARSFALEVYQAFAWCTSAGRSGVGVAGMEKR